MAQKALGFRNKQRKAPWISHDVLKLSDEGRQIKAITTHSEDITYIRRSNVKAKAGGSNYALTWRIVKRAKILQTFPCINETEHPLLGALLMLIPLSERMFCCDFSFSTFQFLCFGISDTSEDSLIS